LSSLVEIQRWVLSWGADVRVVQPAALRESVREAVRKVLAQ
jgi:predicted DNA-binding transcriptional regulator YafY